MAEDDSKLGQVSDYNEHLRMAKVHAEHEIMALFTKLGPPGANDKEPGQLLNLVKEVKAGQIEPLEGINRAMEIYHGKNMDH